MNDSPVARLVQYRLQQAQDSLNEAETLEKSSMYRGAINRAYYAMFYAALALATLQQKATSKHSGVIAFFDQEYVKTGIFPRELSRSFHKTFQRRQENDYGDISSINLDEARQAIVEAREFVSRTRSYLDSLENRT